MATVWGVVDYVREEVERQGHDVTSLDGIERVGWMLDGWSYALTYAHDPLSLRPTIDDVERIGKRVERIVNTNGFRSYGVRVGGRGCPDPNRIRQLLGMLWQQREILTPLEFYKGFEEIHPFGDGNGRTGKILLNWLNDSLSCPIFPPADLWGRPIRNP